MIVIETCPNCGADLVNSVVDVDPPIFYKECFSCGWMHRVSSGPVIRVPFGNNHQEGDYLSDHRNMS